MAQASVIEKPVKKTFMDKLLDGVEVLGNKVPHPVMMFVYLIAFVIVLSTVLALFGISVTETVIDPSRSRSSGTSTRTRRRSNTSLLKTGWSTRKSTTSCMK